jgi:pyruvate dehydrogenase E2 component (dihydrolipoamide acetyltransferase)
MASLTDVRVPDIGGYTDVPIIEVLVAAGATVALETPLIVLESEKATMEVPSTVAGTIQSVAVKVGDTVSAGDLIITVAPEGDAAPPAAAANEPPPAQAEAVAPPPPPAAPVEPSPPPAPVAPTSGQPVAGPAARHLARTLDVDLARIAGSGRGGRITLEDVARAGAPGAPSGGAPMATGLPPWPSLDFSKFGATTREPLSRIARISGPYLHRNWVGIPHVTQFDEADITDLEAFRKQVNAEHERDGVKVTMVALLAKACASACREFPHFNASLDGDSLILKQYVHIGFAADTPAGLMVPVIRDADRKGIIDIARELTTLSGAARDGTIKREQMEGGSFTISSLGGIGGTAFTPIINAPEVAILGVSRSQTKPVWDGTTFQPRLMLPLSLSYDHRVIDGAQAARFTTHLTKLLAEPARMLL